MDFHAASGLPSPGNPPAAAKAGRARPRLPRSATPPAPPRAPRRRTWRRSGQKAPAPPARRRRRPRGPWPCHLTGHRAMGFLVKAPSIPSTTRICYCVWGKKHQPLHPCQIENLILTESLSICIRKSTWIWCSCVKKGATK